MIMGNQVPDGGSLKIGETVKSMYVDQDRTMDGGRTVFEEITDGAEEIDLGGMKVNSRAYCGWFNFKGATQQQKVGNLSGGERNRLHLAKVLRSGGNMLLLGALNGFGQDELFAPTRGFYSDVLRNPLIDFPCRQSR